MSLETLDPIGLDELVEVASLQTRVDRKYIVARRELDLIFGGLEAGTRMLEIDGTRSFGYESVYFDTADLASFLGAAHRRRRRFKVRTRTYVDSAECYLEVKTPGGRDATVKERLEHDVSMPAELGLEGEEYAADLLDDVDVAGLMPILRTSYKRGTLYLPSSKSRATIDLDLAWTLETGMRLELPHAAIVETKSGSTPSAVDRLLWRHHHRPVSISKYATGMAALVPTLPSNKWEPVLSTWFRPQLATQFRERTAS
jgi:hypothetical protein